MTGQEYCSFHPRSLHCNGCIAEPPTRPHFNHCSLDKGLLKGGLREGHHTEVAGESGSGKTQLCMQVCIGPTCWIFWPSDEGDITRTPYFRSWMIPRPSGASKHEQMICWWNWDVGFSCSNCMLYVCLQAKAGRTDRTSFLVALSLCTF